MRCSSPAPPKAQLLWAPCLGSLLPGMPSHPTLDGLQVRSHRAPVTCPLALQRAHPCFAPSCRQHHPPQGSHQLPLSPRAAPTPTVRDPSTVPLPPQAFPAKRCPSPSCHPGPLSPFPVEQLCPFSCSLLCIPPPPCTLLPALQCCTACSISPSHTAAGAFSCSELLYRAQLLLVKAFFLCWVVQPSTALWVCQGVYKYLIPRCVPVNSVTYFALMMYVGLNCFPMDVFVPRLFVFTNKALLKGRDKAVLTVMGKNRAGSRPS